MTIIRGMRLADYFASPSVSHSKLKDFAKSPLLYYQRWVSNIVGDDEETTKAFTFGKAFEAMVCHEGAVKMALNSAIVVRDAEYEYIVKPEHIDFRTKDGKAWREAHAGKTLITHAEYETMVRMVEALREHDTALAMIAECEQQVTLTAEVGGIQLQARPDFLNIRGSAFSEFRPYSADLKTADSLERILSGRAVVEYGHHRQAEICGECMRQNGIEFPVHYLIVVEKTAPHRCVVLEISGAFLAQASSWLFTRLIELEECMKANRWPRYKPGIHRLERPAWLQDEEATA